jgi:phosphatidylglycerophosphatase A
MSNPSSKKSAAFWFATVGGTGLAPGMPGTAGTCVGVLLWYCTTLLPYSLILQLLLFVCLFFLGVWASRSMEQIMKRKDPSEVVIDETAAVLIPFFGLPFSWITCIAGFILFRLFDITKPFPINRLERIKGGWGIMIDDVGAGIFSLIILRILLVYIN